MADRVFISSSRADATFAQGLANYLGHRGFEAWLAATAIEPGQPFASAISDAVQSADAAVLVISDNEPSDWIRAEWSLVLDAHWRSSLRTLLAVIVGDATRIPGFLHGTQTLHAPVAREQWEETFREVADAIGAERDVAAQATDPSLETQLRDRLGTLTKVARTFDPDKEDLVSAQRKLRDLATYLAELGPPPAERADVLQQLAVVDLLRLGDFAEAESLLRDAVQYYQSAGLKDRVAGAQYNLGLVQLETENLDAAIDTLSEVLTYATTETGRADALAAATSSSLGIALGRAGRLAEAREMLQHAIELGAPALGSDHATVMEYRRALEGLDA